MSILIKGMEMPESCDDCWALDDYGDYPRCRITEEQRGYNFPIREKRMGDCPLVPVPPHGDLIDRDALIQFEITMPRGDGYSDFVFAGHIHQAPTIIPAEEGER